MADIAVAGAGPAGLMAAEILAGAGHSVTVYDHRPSAGRKFLMAGRGGLNLTHSEDLERFIGRYGAAADWLAPMIRDFPPAALRAWCESLGEETFIGSSGRVFPRSFKASPLLRAWQARLAGRGVRMAYGWRWTGWDEGGRAVFAAVDGRGKQTVDTAALLLALGGASWPRLGSDGGWTAALAAQDVRIEPLRPANCGFGVGWTTHVSARFAGQPLKPVVLTAAGESVRGEAMITARGIEGGAVYALSSRLRDGLAAGDTLLYVDLRPDVCIDDLVRRLAAAGRESFSTALRKRAGLGAAAAAVLRDAVPDAPRLSPGALAAAIKAAPLRVTAPFPIDRAISSAGGVARGELDENLMLRRLPGVFVAGEMIDWEAPTGGYLLQAVFATGVRAARGIESWLRASAAAVQ